MAAVIDGDRANYISAHPGPAALDPKHRLAGIGQARVGSASALTGTDPLLLMATDPVIAHGFVIGTRNPRTLRQL
jgi:hypothetical protein